MNENMADNLSNDMASESQMGAKYFDPGLFPADKLISKMGENMAISEAMVNENPLWTPKTAELEEKEDDEQ